MVDDVQLDGIGREAVFAPIENSLHRDFDRFIYRLNSRLAVDRVEALRHHDVLAVDKLE